MSYNTSSTNITVFPSSKRATSNVTTTRSKSARLMSEYNLISLVNTILDVKSFVISNNETFDSTNTIDFNICGYYFKVDDMADIITSNTNNFDIYANISFATADGYTELQGQDSDGDNGSYTGVDFSFGSPTTANNLKLLKYNSLSSSYYIPEESKLKYNVSGIRDENNNKIDFTIIDGGTIS